MSLRIGDTALLRLFLGETEIDQAYLGDVAVLEPPAPPSRVTVPVTSDLAPL